MGKGGGKELKENREFSGENVGGLVRIRGIWGMLGMSGAAARTGNSRGLKNIKNV